MSMYPNAGHGQWSSGDVSATVDVVVQKGTGAAYGAAILGGAAVVALLAIGIALVWQFVVDTTWRNILLIILLIVGIVIILMWLWALFSGIRGRC